MLEMPDHAKVTNFWSFIFVTFRNDPALMDTGNHSRQAMIRKFA